MTPEDLELFKKHFELYECYKKHAFIRVTSAVVLLVSDASICMIIPPIQSLRYQWRVLCLRDVERLPCFSKSFQPTDLEK